MISATGNVNVVNRPADWDMGEFDFEVGSGYIILPVTFQGTEYPFVLDTAGMENLFDDSFKDKLGKRFL